MAATAPTVEGRSYEEFVRMHAERFAAYLRGLLGLQAEGRGGRVAVDDTLQDALLAIYAEWPELQDVRDDERDRRMYRCLRDAAGQALRAELGRRGSAESRPRFVSLDQVMQSLNDDAPARDRELTASLLGTMVREMAASEAGRDARLTLDRGILIAGLRALSEREAVVLIAVDHLGWEQHQLAERLGLGYSLVRQTLFAARKIFYTVVRHAVGIEVEDEERAQLAAYLRGELKGPEKRAVRRHLQHCAACRDLQREQRVFGRDALGVLAPLPFVFGAQVLVKRSPAKAATVGSGAGTGLLTQPGAAKAGAFVLGLLTFGFGGSAVLAQLDHDHHHRGPAAPGVVAPASAASQPPFGGMRRVAAPSSRAASTTTKTSAKAKRRKRTATGGSRKQAPSHASTTSTRQTTPQSSPPPTSNNTNSSPSPSKSTQKSTASSCEFFCG
jgi:DNA-directed RNA polymerase specialized sigma24 family protein